MYLDDDDNIEQPPEPDWDELRDMLDKALDWLVSEEGRDQSNSNVRAEAIGIALGTFSGCESGEDSDTLTRKFFQDVNRAAFWLADYTDCVDLADWVKRFCVEPERIASEMLREGTQGEA